MRNLKFESLNGELLSKVEGGNNAIKPTHSSQSTDHACGSNGCGSNAGLLITKI